MLPRWHRRRLRECTCKDCQRYALEKEQERKAREATAQKQSLREHATRRRGKRGRRRRAPRPVAELDGSLSSSDDSSAAGELGYQSGSQRQSSSEDIEADGNGETGRARSRAPSASQSYLRSMVRLLAADDSLEAAGEWDAVGTELAPLKRLQKLQKLQTGDAALRLVRQWLLLRPAGWVAIVRRMAGGGQAFRRVISVACCSWEAGRGGPGARLGILGLWHVCLRHAYRFEASF